MTKTTSARQQLAPGWVRLGMQGGSRLAPGLTAALTRRLLFQPLKAKVRPKEAEVLARAERFTLGDGLRGYAWGQGPRVLLVHGWGGHAGQWAPLVGALVGAGHRAVALDLPGHGPSGAGQTSLVHFAEALTAVSSHLGPFEAVVAHSLGTAATLIALEGGLVAGRVVFLAPVARFSTVWGQARERLGISQAIMDAALEGAQAWLQTRFEAIEPLPRAARQQTPLTVLHSRDDREMPFEEGETLAAAWPGARLEAYDTLGHLRLLRDAAVVRRVVEVVAGARLSA